MKGSRASASFARHENSVEARNAPGEVGSADSAPSRRM
jgi:hypothetical protein